MIDRFFLVVGVLVILAATLLTCSVEADALGMVMS